MVNPHEDRDSVLRQGREPEHGEEPERQAGRLPYAGEIVGREEPPYKATGLDALSPLLSHIDFPTTKREIVARIGQAVIPIDRQRTARVADVLSRAAPELFRSSTEVEDALRGWLHEQGPGETRGGHQKQGDNTSGRRVS